MKKFIDVLFSFETLLHAIACFVIIHYSSWQIYLGIVIFVWASNIAQSKVNK